MVAEQSGKLQSEKSIMSYLMGIDVGSTNLKAVLFGYDGKIVAKADTPTELVRPEKDHPDWAVWQPQQMWSGIAQSIRKVVAGIDASAVKGVAVTGMGMDGVPLDATGKWLYPFISWHCPRTLPQQKWWIEQVGIERQFQIGGDQIWPFNTALRLRWMKEHQPAILERTHKWVLIEDFINFMLCGEYATDFSMASTTLLFDQSTRSWNEELLKRAEIDKRLLCDPQPAGTVVGEVHQAAAQLTGLKIGTPVVLGGHDYSCGCLPTGAYRPGVVLDVLGTWEMVVAALDKPVLTREVQELGVLVDSHVARDKYAVMGATVAADNLEWARREFCGEEERRAAAEGGSVWDSIVDLAEQSPVGSNGVFFLPHMSGSHCPVLDHTSAGAFVGLRNLATRGDMLRALIEGLNYQFTQIVRAFEKSLHVKSDRIEAIGGPTKNRFWMQNKADVSGTAVNVPDIEEAVPLGAAILAGIGAGIYHNEDDAFEQVHRAGKIYEPNPANHEKYEELYARFGKLQPSLKPFYSE
jgi:xylulokinase